MWRDMEEDALLMGLDLHYFWSLNPKQFSKHIKVFNQKEKNRLKEFDTLNYILGKYIAYGVNDPKHYPRKPFSENEQKQLNPLPADEMERVAKLNTQLLGGVINDGR